MPQSSGKSLSQQQECKQHCLRNMYLIGLIFCTTVCNFVYISVFEIPPYKIKTIYIRQEIDVTTLVGIEYY